MAYRSESTEMISNEEGGGKKRHQPAEITVIETLSDFDLEQIAESFIEGNTEDLSYYGLEREDIRFYERIYDAYKGNSNIENAGDWLSVLKGVQRTYNTLKEIYKAHKIKGVPNKAAIEDIESIFGVSREKCQQFARRRDRDILDWVFFIEREQ